MQHQDTIGESIYELLLNDWIFSNAFWAWYYFIFDYKIFWKISINSKKWFEFIYIFQLEQVTIGRYFVSHNNSYNNIVN